MENLRPINHWQIIKRDWRKVLVVVLIVVLIALVLTLIQPFLYRSTVSVLVLQKSGFSIDAYSASKSEERIANKLSQVVDSSLFLNSVLNSGFDVDESYFPDDELKRRNKWSDTVEAEVPGGLSKLRISVYHRDPNQALQISQAVAYILTAEKSNYIGIEDVDLRVLDSPLVSKYPVRPNILVNIVLGIILGLIAGVAFVILTYNPTRDKLFVVPEDDEATPHLIEDDGLLETEDIDQEVAQVPEIDDLEEVEELAEPESTSQELSFEEEAIDLPNLSEEVAEKKEEEDFNDEEIKEEEQPGFDDEDKIIGMPGK